MADTIIACLSQKGGVGKSTMSRLIATAYAKHGMRTCIADFNGNQLTSVDWAEARQANGIMPEVSAAEFKQANRMQQNKDFDVIVADGKPDGAEVTLSIAKAANAIVIPTSVTFDDVKPQLAFAESLVAGGVDARRIIFVVNRPIDSEVMVRSAIKVIESRFKVAKNVLPIKASYAHCQNSGYAISEVRSVVMGNVSQLADLAEGVALEVATLVQELDNE